MNCNKVNDKAMSQLTRRNFVGAALAIGAQLAWSTGRAAPSQAKWRERRDLFPEGVASGDPHPDSVILWTRRPFEKGSSGALLVEVSEDEAFTLEIESEDIRRRRLDLPCSGRRAETCP